MRAFNLAALTLLAAGALACSDEETTGPSAQDLAGTWRVTRMEFVSVANPTDTVEAIGLGATVTAELDLDHSVRLVMSFPGLPSETETGTWSATATTMTWLLSGPRGRIVFEMSLSGTTMHLTGGEVEFDFDQDGTDEAATLNLHMVKQQ